MSLDDPHTWTPAESAFDLLYERAWLSGVCIGAVAYGVHATLFFITFKLLWERPRATYKDYIWIVYVLTIFTISTVGNGLQLKTAQLFFIDYRNYPGPLSGWEAGSPVPLACNAVYIVNLWLQDALLLYRFGVIVSRGYAVLALPALMLLSTIAVGCTTIFMLTQPGVTIWAHISTDLLTAYFSLSISFNIILTLAIVTKLLVTRRRLGKDVTDMSPYLSVSAMLIESAALYSVFGILYFVATGIHSIPMQRLLLPIQGQVQSIAPMLIIMRVAQGRAWSTGTAERATVSSMAFRKGTTRTGTNTFPLASLSSSTRGGASSQPDTLAWSDRASKFGDKPEALSVV